MSSDLLQQGKEFMETLQLSPAREAFEKALAANPNSSEARVWLARIAFMKQDQKSGMRHLEKLLAAQPDHAEALTLMGISFMQREDYAQAADWLEKARQSDPALKMIYFNLAKSYRKIGKMNLAEEAVRAGIKLNPENSDDYFELSHICAATGRMKEAIESLLKSIEKNPLFLRAYLMLGELYKQAGKGDLVIMLYQEGLRHAPSAFRLHEELCSLYSLKLDFASACEEAQKMTRKRDFYGDYLRLGTYALAMGKIEEAEKAFQKAAELNPQNWQAHYDLAELYRSARNILRAKAEYEAAISRDSNQFKPYNGLGIIALHEEKDFDKAREYFLRALEISPGQLEPLLNMALACTLSHDNEAAKKFATAALSLARPETQIYQEAQRLLTALKN